MTQSKADRRKAGRVEVHCWFQDATAKELKELQEWWGLLSVRDVIAAAIKRAHQAEGELRGGT